MAGIEKQDHDPGVEQQLQANRLVSKNLGMAIDKRSRRDIPTKVPTSPHQPTRPHQIAASPIKKTARRPRKALPTSGRLTPFAPD